MTVQIVLPPPAGKGSGCNTGVAECLREEARPTTPWAISKWRRSVTALPGQRVGHPGQVGDAKEVNPRMSFGSVDVKSSDHVADIWQQVPMCDSRL